MMDTDLRFFASHFKTLFAALALMALAACSTNPATGQQQFTALMSPSQEMKVGAEEHSKVMQIYGVPENSENLQIYVTNIGQSVAKNTERPDVNYKFFVLDDPMVNAFALPGGYVYVTRGLLAQANNEAQLAAVLGHEVGHVTARHSAERYSQGVVTSLGAAVLAAAVNSDVATQALGVGSDLFLKSYSRAQENEADELGIRYIARAGYDPRAMTGFLSSLEGYTQLESMINGQGGPGVDWFSTHPLTADRVQKTMTEAAQYPAKGVEGRDQYLSMIDGLVYGDSAKKGLIRDNKFYHPAMDFMFAAPSGFKIINQPEQVVASNNQGTVIIFDAAGNPQGLDPLTYMTQSWMKDANLGDAEAIEINGKKAATASFQGTVSGRPAMIRIVGVAWAPNRFFRFQMAYPPNASAALLDELKRTTYSLRPMTAEEKQTVQPYRIRIVTARAGDTVASLAQRMPFTTYQEARFRALNAMGAGESLTAGRKYKIVSSK